MSAAAQITLSAVALGITFWVVRLVGLRQLRSKYALLWLVITVPLVPLAVFQDWLGGIFGRQRYLTRAVAKNMMGGDTDYSSAKAEKVLGMNWEDFDTCIQDTVDVFL